MKVLVLGDEGIGRQITAALAISLASKSVEIVNIKDMDEVEPNDGDILICDDDHDIIFKNVYCGSPLGNIGAIPIDCSVGSFQQDNSFRGGSIGKGGKIKYRRS